MRSRGDLGPIGSVKREAHHSVLRNYRVRYLEKAQAVADSSDSKNMTADEQRRFNREMANVGEASKLLLEFGEPDTEHERIAHERFSPEGKRRTLAMLRLDQGGTSAREEKLWLPSMPEYKSLSIGNDPAGGYLVPPVNLPGFFDYGLRPASIFLSAGPRIVKTPTQRVNLPKIGTPASVVNVGEAATITESALTIETAALSMQKFACRTIASSEVMADANPDLRVIVQQDHSLALAASLDRQFIEGTGVSGQLLGLRNQSGVTTTTLGAGNGAVPTLGDIADALYWRRTPKPARLSCRHEPSTPFASCRIYRTDISSHPIRARRLLSNFSEYPYSFRRNSVIRRQPAVLALCVAISLRST